MSKRFLILGLCCGSLFSLSTPVQAAERLQDVNLTPWFWWIAPVGSIIALVFAFIFFKQMLKADEGNPTMREIAADVRKGAMAYVARQYKVVAGVFVVLMFLLIGLAYLGVQNPFVPIAFLSGGFFSALCGLIGMKTSTYASGRTAEAVSHSLNRGLKVAFRSGAVMGLVVVGFGLLDICLWYLVLDKFVYTPENMATGLEFLGLVLVPEDTTVTEKIVHITGTMITFGMGASTQALFARVGGGIYTKAADVGADLVGKVESGIPEDDPRNPATIADNVGDNVGDIAGLGADLYESYCGSILATALLGASVGAQRVAEAASEADYNTAIFDTVGFVTAPMIVAGIGIIFSLIGIGMVRCKEEATQKNLLTALLVGTLSSSVLILAAVSLLAVVGVIPWGIFGSVVAGLLAGVIIGQATEFYTSNHYGPTKKIAEQGQMGPATTIIEGLGTGMYSAGLPVVTVVVAIIAAFGFAGGFNDFSFGLYGIGFGAVGMLATLGITLATDAYGPIADNAGGNAEMAGLEPYVRERTDALDALGNTTAATGKGFAIGSAALTALALLAAYLDNIKLWVGKFAGETTFMDFTAQQAAAAHPLDFVDTYSLHIMNPLLLCGIFTGSMVAFVFSAMTMKAVGRAAGEMVTEVRRQFKEFPGIIEGTKKPDYARCVAISTKGAQKEMILPALLAIAVPISTGLVLGVAGVMGLLAGGLATSFVLATMLNNAGGAWDNAKKYVEEGAYGGKQLPDGNPNPVHSATVIGDTVGDPCKDTAGPSLDILIKLMSIISVVFAPVVVKYSPVIQEFLNIK